MTTSFTINEINKIAENLLIKVKKKKLKNSMIIALSGELGAGKTTLTQEVAKLLGIREKLISPTFVIMKKYKTKDKKFKNLIHIDAYRLDNTSDLLKLGWQEIKTNKENLIIIEWPERVSECLEGEVLNVFLGHKDEKTRTVKILL